MELIIPMHCAPPKIFQVDGAPETQVALRTPEDGEELHTNPAIQLTFTMVPGAGLLGIVAEYGKDIVEEHTTAK